MMAGVRTSGTGPELRVRSFLHQAGLRFRVNRRDLPGSPDIVLPRFRSVIFVHGCFWHQHACCTKRALPKSNRDFWRNKLTKNVGRDRESTRALVETGWTVHVAWECQLKDEHLDALVAKILHGQV